MAEKSNQRLMDECSLSPFPWFIPMVVELHFRPIHRHSALLSLSKRGAESIDFAGNLWNPTVKAGMTKVGGFISPLVSFINAAIVGIHRQNREEQLF
ncbi:MAG: hypothetical protein AAF468_07150 [Pseudomonadota bacterium]